jgi:hypothetical protein
MEPNAVETPNPPPTRPKRVSWNKGKLIGQKAPLKLKEIYAIRTRLQMGNRVRELALFNLAIDSKLRGCDLVKLRVSNIAQSDHAAGDCDAAKDATPGAVRADAANA